MTINKFQGKTEEEAIAKAKQEFGENAVIMNVKEVKPKGLFRAFKNSTVVLYSILRISSIENRRKPWNDGNVPVKMTVCRPGLREKRKRNAHICGRFF